MPGQSCAARSCAPDIGFFVVFGQTDVARSYTRKRILEQTQAWKSF
jgi:hypothetical protein